MWARNEQTICAISTPHGLGGIAVIRVSGAQAFEYSKKIVQSFFNKESLTTHKAYFSNILDFEGQKVDEALVTYFKQGQSFTGEESVEISCHGSMYITQQILDLLIKCGCRIADKGEFTYRAFMSGNLDLVQAESVLSLIESQSKASAKVALRQLDGHVSKEFEKQISDLTWCLAHIEASIDFAEQGIEVVDTNILIVKLKNIEAALNKLILSYRSGKLIKDGVKVALIGEPNVGKSSLLNLLLQNDKAIVTPIAGTTRDVVEGDVVYNGVKYSLNDTAGLRETQDQVEIIGIDKSKKVAENSDVMCFVFDCTNKDWAKSLQLMRHIKGSKKLFLFNKSENLSEGEKRNLISQAGVEGDYLFTSALVPESRDQIFALISKSIGSFEYLDEAVISSSRQLEQAEYSFEMISSSLRELEKNTGAEFVAMYLKESLISLQKILGQVYDDQIMDRVFKEFCLGK